MAKKKIISYCCKRFEECVKNDEIRHTGSDDDETEWYFTGNGDLGHLYYCPYCGEFIMGKGFGKPWKTDK